MHAVMIIAHNQFELLEKLILALDDVRNDIFVHIDAKVSDFDFEKFSKLTSYSRVVFTDNRINVTWGDVSQVLCEYELLKTAVANENQDNPYSYFHLISGVDLPIKSNDYIHNFFDENNGKEFIHFTNSKSGESSEGRIRYYHFFRSRRNAFTKILSQALLKLQKLLGVNRLKGADIKVQKGCNWFSITGEFAHYVVDNFPRYEKYFKHSYCCDEVFLQTMFVNSPFNNNLYMPDCNNNHEACVRYIDWERGNPYVFRKEDFELLKSSPCIFARKFDLNTDCEIIDMILNYRS